MLRLIAAAAFSMFLAHATGAYPFLVPVECPESCPDDQPDGRCAPACMDCTCCFHLQPVPAAATASPCAAAPCWGRVGDVGRAPPAPEPREIPHVPKAALA